MSTPRYYVRSRGKITGPYDLKNLQLLRERGHLARFHEVSEDRSTWLPAETVFERFSSEAPQVPPPAPLILWHYQDHRGERHGPVPPETITHLWAEGLLNDSTLVWREGDPHWLPLSSQPAGLVLPPARRTRGRRAVKWAAGFAAAVLLAAGTAAATLWLIEKTRKPQDAVAANPADPGPDKGARPVISEPAATAKRNQEPTEKNPPAKIDFASVADSPKDLPGPNRQTKVESAGTAVPKRAPPEISVGSDGAAVPKKDPPDREPEAKVDKEKSNPAKSPDTAGLDPGQVVYARLLKSAAYVETEDGYGCGTLIDVENRLVVTNYHVVEDEAQVFVLFPTFHNGKLLSEIEVVLQQLKKDDACIGRVVHRDSTRDLALISLDRLPKDVLPLVLAQSSPSPGQQLHSVGGRPKGNESAFWIYSSGTVRQVYRKQWTFRNGQKCDAMSVVHQIPINPGDSGSAIVNERSELVAVNSGGVAGADLVKWGIDVTEVRDMLNRYARSTGTKLQLPSPMD